MEIAMKYYDQAPKADADSGLRTANDWTTLGRGVKPGTTPRADAAVRLRRNARQSRRFASTCGRQWTM